MQLNCRLNGLNHSTSHSGGHCQNYWLCYETTDLLRQQSLLITSYFDKLEEKDKEIKALKDTIGELKSHCEILEKHFEFKIDWGARTIREAQCDPYPQRSGQGHSNSDPPKWEDGVPYDADSYVKALCKDKLGVEIPPNGIGRSHPTTGKPKNDGSFVVSLLNS
jgi:hypothetical protein